MKRLIVAVIIISITSIGSPYLRQVQRRFVGVNQEVYLDHRNMEYYFEREVHTIVTDLAREINQEPQNARIHKETGAIIPEEHGLWLDVEATVEAIMSANRGSRVTPKLIEIIPEISWEMLAQLDTILGEFTTPLMGSPGRVTNIRLSLVAINNTLLMPGETFSFNEVVGERTVEKGYKSAPIILGESVIPGVGGGICQVSTTLYNAVRRSGLEVVERRIHSIAPSYIQHGMDATVAWPHTDFKFRNDSEVPIIVKGGVEGWRVRVWIVGRE